MRTAWPATWAAFPLCQDIARPFDPVRPGFGLFGRGHPADKFIARERRNIFPCRLCFGGSEESLLEVGRQVMDDTAL